MVKKEVKKRATSTTKKKVNKNKVVNANSANKKVVKKKTNNKKSPTKKPSNKKSSNKNVVKKKVVKKNVVKTIKKKSINKKKVVKKVAKKTTNKILKKPLIKSKKNIIAKTPLYIIKEVPDKYVFVVINGSRICTLHDLAQCLDNMSHEAFHFHSNETKNDFSTWIHDIHEEVELAERMWHKDKNEASIIVKQFLKEWGVEYLG